MSDSIVARINVLQHFGANEVECEELLNYNSPRFEVTDDVIANPIPLPDEPFVEAWQGYLDASIDAPLYSVLQSKFSQLAFPIAEAISTTSGYKNATLKGHNPAGMEGATGLVLECPNELKLTIHSTPTGHIPILTPGSRHDFEQLVQAFSSRNEPELVPASMGACTVTGFNNWDRVARYQESWQAENPGKSWKGHFPTFIKQKALYRDRFIILSQGYYSGAGAFGFGYTDDEWLKRSYLLRREHECAHYLTLRLFGSMSNNLFDEILADFAGLLAANDQVYCANHFLKFMGLESKTIYREGARLENYRSDPPLSDGSFNVLQGLVRAAANNIEIFYSANKHRSQDISTWILALASTTLEFLASEDAPRLLQQNLDQVLNIRKLNRTPN
jgi:hypothetical protein